MDLSADVSVLPFGEHMERPLITARDGLFVELHVPAPVRRRDHDQMYPVRTPGIRFPYPSMTIPLTLTAPSHAPREIARVRTIRRIVVCLLTILPSSGGARRRPLQRHVIRFRRPDAQRCPFRRRARVRYRARRWIALGRPSPIAILDRIEPDEKSRYPRAHRQIHEHGGANGDRRPHESQQAEGETAAGKQASHNPDPAAPGDTRDVFRHTLHVTPRLILPPRLANPFAAKTGNCLVGFVQGLSSGRLSNDHAFSGEAQAPSTAPRG